MSFSLSRITCIDSPESTDSTQTTPVMARLKPTILISLDRHAAAFCERVQFKLERDLGYRGSLVQSYGLKTGSDSGPAIEKDLSTIADFTFTLDTPSDGERPSAEAAQRDFEAGSAKLEPELSEILEAGRRAADIEKARQSGIELARNRLVYLVLSSTDSIAGGTIIELSKLVRWLFATRFTQELYELHAVVLLPNLFEQAQQADFATAYALLKTLDHHISTGLAITQTRKMPPFDGCWLIDGINSRGEKIGTLAEDLDSYTDAFTGFLTSEPEKSGALVGTRTSRGKVPAYSAFGHGELYLPVEIAVKRLGSVLSRDIIDRAFLGQSAAPSDLERKLLLAAKQFVVAEEYRSAVNGIETDRGALIWQDLPQPAELQNESNVLEYAGELQRRHARFERESLPKFKQALVTRSETCLKDLVKLLDREIDRQIDQKPEGLSEAPSLLQRLIDHSIALHANALGERPQNFITDLFAAEAALDSKLGVHIDHSKTEVLLKQVDELNNRLADLENTLRITMPRELDDQSETVEEDEAAESLRSEQQSLASDIEETRSEVTAASALYVRELFAEEREANQARYEAKDKTRAIRSQAVTAAEEEIVRTGAMLGKARLDLEDKQQQRHKFLVRHFIIYPALVALVFMIPTLGSFLGIPFAAEMVAFFLLSQFVFLVSLIVSLAIYTAIVLYIFMNGINKTVEAARHEVSSLELRLKAARVRLVEARNLQLRLEYDIYAQSMRVETMKNLIETTGQRISELETTFKSLGDSRERFAVQEKSAVPTSSYMRRPVLEAVDIDAFYVRDVNAGAEATAFIRDHMPRSQVRRIPIEEFERSVEAFTSNRFRFLTELSIEDALLRSPDLVSNDRAGLRLEELDRAATPLVLLSEMDLNDDTFAQKDVTIWAGATDSEVLLQHYRKVNSTTTIRPSQNEHTLRSLTRCLNFPAFYLSQIEFYRSCYDRTGNKDAADLPDIIPQELTISSDARRAYEQLLVAIATGLISNNGNGAYQLVNGNGSIVGNSRRQVAEKFALDYGSQKIYSEISNRVARTDSDTVYRSLTDFLETATDLEPFEREMLVALSQKYHPLR